MTPFDPFGRRNKRKEKALAELQDYGIAADTSLETLAGDSPVAPEPATPEGEAPEPVSAEPAAPEARAPESAAPEDGAPGPGGGEAPFWDGLPPEPEWEPEGEEREAPPELAAEPEAMPTEPAAPATPADVVEQPLPPPVVEPLPPPATEPAPAAATPPVAEPEPSRTFYRLKPFFVYFAAFPLPLSVAGGVYLGLRASSGVDVFLGRAYLAYLVAMAVSMVGLIIPLVIAHRSVRRALPKAERAGTLAAAFVRFMIFVAADAALAGLTVSIVDYIWRINVRA